jgi:hypothetical protein
MLNSRYLRAVCRALDEQGEMIMAVGIMEDNGDRVTLSAVVTTGNGDYTHRNLYLWPDGRPAYDTTDPVVRIGGGRYYGPDDVAAYRTHTQGLMGDH